MTESIYTANTAITPAPKFASLPPVDFTGIEVIRRLRVNLPNLTETKGKTETVLARRYMYLYPDTPNTVFLSDSALTGLDRGIMAFYIYYWDMAGIGSLQRFVDPNPDEETEIARLLEGLEPKDLFIALQKAQPLNVLLATGYISHDCVVSTFDIVAESKVQVSSVVKAGKEKGAPMSMLETMGMGIEAAIEYSKALKPAEVVVTSSSSNPAVTETPRDAVSTPMAPATDRPGDLHIQIEGAAIDVNAKTLEEEDSTSSIATKEEAAKLQASFNNASKSPKPPKAVARV